MANQKRVLIIEDDIDMVEVMKIILEANNYEVISSYNPEEGFQKAKSEKPDLIILDMMFGGRSEAKGFDYVIKMKQDKVLTSVPILIVTAMNKHQLEFYSSPGIDREYLPVNQFINKPVKPDEFIIKVNKLIKLRINK